MATKFRNSLFGFNKEDVHSFVMTTKENEYKYENKIREMQGNIDELTAAVEKFSSEVAALTDKLDKASIKIKDYEEREEALTRLSESIGRLYLVAQTNAQSIAAAAKDSIEASKQAVLINMEAADSAENNFAEIERRLNDRVSAFNSEIAELRYRLTETKERLQQNTATIEANEQNLNDLTAEIGVK